ncbi:hypothetical protein [Rhodanobacter aciditrophus]|uniref:hypothetical protein n=1 Tax=Rhodanobacter aciditrophus TaxID=1623218 RepID=UPI003CEEDC82
MTTSIREALALEIAHHHQCARSQAEVPDERAAARAAHEAAARAKEDGTPALAVLDVLAFVGGGECSYQVTHVAGGRVAARPISNIGRFTGPAEIGLAVGKTTVMFVGFNGQARAAQRTHTRAQVLQAMAERRTRILQARAAATPLPD